MDDNAHRLIEKLSEEYVNDSTASDDQLLLATILVVLNDISKTLERIEKK